MSEKTPLTRRTALKSLVAASSVALAGCSGDNSNGGDTVEGSSTTDADTPTPTSTAAPVIESVEPDGYSLSVTLVGGQPVDSIGLINPDGQSVSQQSVQPGATQTSLSLSGYTAGTNTVVASRDDTVVDQTEVVLEPQLELVDVGHMSQRDQLPDFGDAFGVTGIPYKGLWLTIANTGDITIRIDNVDFDVSEWPEDDEGYGSEIMAGSGAYPRTIEPGVEYSYATRTVVLRRTAMCEEVEGELSVTVNTQSGASVSKTYPYRRTTEEVVDRTRPVCRSVVEEEMS